MSADLNEIQEQINAGNIRAAKRSLIALLRAYPQNLRAWELLSTISDNPRQQADCFRQILRIDPDNRRARIRLQALTGHTPQPTIPEKPAAEKEQAIRCPQCGGTMEVNYIGEMQDKRAVCQYCHTEIDLPDTYQRVKKKRTHEQSLGGSRTVEETVIETRHDAQDPASLPPELQEIMRILQEMGPEEIDDQLLQKLRASGINISFDPGSPDPQWPSTHQETSVGAYDGSSLEHISKTTRIQTDERSQGFFGRLFSRKKSSKKKFTPLSTSEIIDLAGGALPPEKRRQCPNPQCGAVIPKDAEKCSWCGQSL